MILESQYHNGQQAITPAIAALENHGQPTETGVAVHADALAIDLTPDELSIHDQGIKILSANQYGVTYSRMESEQFAQVEAIASIEPELVNSGVDLEIG